MNRRGFLKAAIIGSAAATVPLAVAKGLIPMEIGTVDSFRFIPSPVLGRGYLDNAGHRLQQDTMNSIYRTMMDQAAYGTGVMKNGKHIPVTKIFRRPSPFGSPS